MKGRRWIGFVAARYVSRGRKNSPSPVFSVMGIATGVLALTVIIAVMNGFQLGFIESILEISSYHLRIEGLPPEGGLELEARMIENIQSLPEVLSVLPFHEINVLIRGRQANSRGALVRGVPPDALLRDPGLALRLEIESGYFDLESPGNIVLGTELARHLSVRPGDELSLLSITGTIGEAADSSNQVYTVSGIFRSGFYEYDLGWGFINIDRAAELLNTASRPDDAPLVRKTPVIGIKLKNRWQDQRAISEIRAILPESGLRSQSEDLTIKSWRDYNRAFFGALRTEKLMMFILVGLIFIVVGLNIFQAQRRTVLERREEIGLLRALGASDTAVRLVFAWDGFIIGLAGSGIGLSLGLFIAFHIPFFFSMLETAVNLIISGINYLLALWGTEAGPEEFSVFSPRIFYIKEIPSRVVPLEALLIFLFGFFSALFAAWFASGKVSRTKPVEVLRYE